MKNHAAATVRNRILKGAALCGVLALSMTLTGCFVPPDDLSGDLSNQGVVYNTVAVSAPPRTATPTPSPTPTVESVFNFGTNTATPTTQPGVITSNGIVTVVTTPPGSVATTDRLVRTMHSLARVPMAEAVKMASATPARHLNIFDKKGSIAVGKDADLLFFDDDVHIRRVLVRGETVEDAS